LSIRRCGEIRLEARQTILNQRNVPSMGFQRGKFVGKVRQSLLKLRVCVHHTLTQGSEGRFQSLLRYYGKLLHLLKKSVRLSNGGFPHGSVDCTASRDS
jgi:hypothetical protein